jgi:hypothetical protein
MSGKTASAALALTAALTAGLALAGCHFQRPPVASRPATARPGDPAAARLADAPALLVQCAADRAGLRPRGQDWFSGGRVRISPTDAAGFETWWRAHLSPGPYPQTFVIDGHRTRYLAFGTTWVRLHGQWVPKHSSPADPRTAAASLYHWSVWAAEQDRLPPAVCGQARSARTLQDQVYGTATGNPWGG